MPYGSSYNLNSIPGLEDGGRSGQLIWEFSKIRVPYFGVLIIRILLFGVLHEGPLFSETPM